MSGNITGTRAGMTRGKETIRARFWTPLLGTNTAPALITKGAVCFPDFNGRGAYTSPTLGTTRAAIGGAPAYGSNDGSPENPLNNLTVLNDGAGVAQANRFQPAVLDQDSLANGQEGTFAIGGSVIAQTNGAIVIGNRLSVDTTNNTTAGKLKVAAVNDLVVAIARQDQGGNMWLVDMVEPYQATTTGAL